MYFLEFNDAPIWVKKALIALVGWREYRTKGGSIEWWKFDDGVVFLPEIDQLTIDLFGRLLPSRNDNP